MDQSDAHLALKSLAEFWADMGLEEARALTVQRGGATQRVNPPARGFDRQPERPAGPRPPPRRLANNPVADARKLASEAATLADLRSAIQRFDGCTLKAGAKNTAVCDGAFDAPVMIVGEAPGADEDIQGLPFVGRAGKLLDRMLETIGLSRKTNVYITNLVYWRPPGNREPSTTEMEVCSPLLKRQIELKQPKILLTAGKFATSALLNTTDGIMRLRGRKLRYTQDGLAQPIPCIPLLHPAYLLRRPEDKSKAWEDLRTIAALCDQLGVKREGAL
jgi:uracil-DNA glycosylase